MTNERDARSALFDQIAAASPLVGIEAGRLRFVAETWDDSVARSLFVKQRRSEMRTLAAAVRGLKDHDLLEREQFVDVGANIGTTALPALRWFRTAVAIEPSRPNVHLLKANACLNGLEDRLTVIEAACGDRAGEAMLHLSPTNSGDHRLVPNAGGAARETVTVKVVTLDQLAKERVIGRPGLIWIDAQGSEAAVLRGAGGLDVPTVIEVAPQFLGSEGSVDQLAAATERFGTFVELRRLAKLREWEPQPMPRFREFVQELCDEHRIADLLLLP